MSDPSVQSTPDERLTRAARLRVAAAFVAVLAGTAALVIAVLLVRSTLA
jgi:uncharacterized membrane protein YdcZ (DUF606 family)